jgi:hypothetical protein
MPLIEVDWDNYVFRCHYLGELMSPSRGKSNLEKYNAALAAYNKKFEQVDKMSPGKTMDKALGVLENLSQKVEELKLVKDIPVLSDTCKTRLAQIYTEETTGRVKDIESMYLEKGIRTEEESITAYSLRTGTFHRKNKERISNGFLTGEIDFEDDEKDMVIDTKSSFDIFTFDKTIATGMNKLYEWQGHGYMWLRNKKRFRLAYCLNNTPEDIIQRLLKQLQYRFIGSPEDFEEACLLIREKHTYDDLPLERKIRIYELNRDDEKIEQIKTMIPHFRNYLKNITNTKLEEDEQDY